MNRGELRILGRCETLDRYFVVLLGGGCGALLRYLAAGAIMQRFGGRFPLGTFVINVTGCFMIGLLMTLLTERFQPHPNWRLFLVVGILGGYTTFSTFEYETYASIRQSSYRIAALNILLSVVAGYIAVWLGVVIAGRR
jgi:CrcB protein